MERDNLLSERPFPGGTDVSAHALRTMTEQAAASMATAQPTEFRSDEHPADADTAPSCDLWMIDHNGTTVLGCRCLELSATRMRLCVPIGYGVAIGQRYELCKRSPGEHSFSASHVNAALWVTIVQTQNTTNEGLDRIDVAVVVDPVEPGPVSASSPTGSLRGRPEAIRLRRDIDG